MNWDDLRYFLAAAREGSFLEAGRVLDCNHATVSRRVSQLEAELETTCFERSRTGLSLTSAGEEVLEEAERVEGACFDLVRRVRGRDTALRGPLRVATVDLLAHVLSQVLASFTRKHPDIVLELVTNVAMHSLTRREADVVLRITEGPPEHLVGRVLGKVRYAGYASHALLDSGVIPGWLLWGAPNSQRIMERWLEARLPGSRISLSTNSGTVVLSAVKAGHGATLLPMVLGESAEDLERIVEPDPRLDMTLWVLTHPDLRGTARVRAFMDHVAERVPDLFIWS